MYFVVNFHVGLDEFKESSKLTSVSSAVSFLKEHKDYPVLGYHFIFYNDDGSPLACNWLCNLYGTLVPNISNYTRLRSVAAFRYDLSNCIKIAKYYEYPF